MSNQTFSLRIATIRRGSLHPRIPLAIIRPVPTIPPEHTTRVCAMALAARLTAWWHTAGFPGAKFWPVENRPSAIEQFDESGKLIDLHKRWDIRSNLVNGIPPELQS